MTSFQIISFNSSGKLEVKEEGIKILNTLGPKHVIISIAGPYRSGKSFISNLLTNSDTFRVGSTVQACTQGIWVQQVLINKQSFLFLDVEGFGSTGRSNMDDGKLFAAALSISSLIIYNSIGVINESKINHLALALNYCQIISSQFKGLSDPPHLLWLLRDFILELSNSEGEKISSNQYLEATLSKLEGKPDSSSSKMREIIKQTFPIRSCITMPRPAEDESTLQNLQNLQNFSMSSLSQNFVKSFNKLKKIVFSAQVKQLNKKVLRGQDISAFLKDIVRCLSSDEIPKLPSTWESIVQNEYKVLSDKFQVDLLKILSEVNNLIPTEDGQIITFFQRFREKVENGFIDCHFCDEKLTTRYILKFSEKIDNELMNLLASNKSACLEHNISLLNSLFPALFLAIENNEFENDIDRLENEWSRVLDEFEFKARGSSKFLAVAEFSKRNSGSEFARLLNDVVLEMNSQILSLRNQEKMAESNGMFFGEVKQEDIMTEIAWNRYKVQEFNRQVKVIQKNVLKKL